LATALLTVALLATSGLSVAANSSPTPNTPQSSMHAQPMAGDAMMDKGMMGKGMMKDCSMMMGKLPAGNEKLAMQMHGEMMKAMGDIMLKYADKIASPSSK